MTDVNSWSQTAASNNSAPPNGFPEGQSPASLNDCGRELMAALARWHAHMSPTVTSGGAANVQTLTYAVAPTALVAGDTFCFIAGFTNTADVTLNVNALGAKAVLGNDGNVLTGREIQSGQKIEVWYDGVSFRLFPMNRQTLTANNGILRLPGGLLLQWGQTTFTATNTVAVTFALAFGAIFQVQTVLGQAAGGSVVAAPGSVTTTGFSFNLSAISTAGGYWLALGI